MTLHPPRPPAATTPTAPHRTAPPEHEQGKALTAPEAGLDAATAVAKAAGQRRPGPMAHRLLLLRRAALADLSAYATELDHLGGGATATRAEHALDKAGTAAAARRTFDVDTDGLHAAGPLPAEHPLRDDEPDTGRSHVRQEYTEWTRTERAAFSRAWPSSAGRPRSLRGAGR
ncbi:hypothetical protein [Streptomyces sp. NPDC014656]|uniref:hypothetical protein n=1 Tax=Streptomyces sp. NPDC014656 TaxID=3364878 RepID=UPI0036F6552F